MGTVRNIERRMFLRRHADRTASARLPEIQVAHRVDWSGIWAGYAVAIGLSVLFSALVLALGLSMASARAASLRVVARHSALWLGVAMLVALFIGAVISGRGTNESSRAAGALHGATLWGLMVLTSLVLGGYATMTATQVAATEAAAMLNAAAQNVQGQLPPGTPGSTQGKPQPSRAAAAEADATLATWAMFSFLVAGLCVGALGGAAGAGRRA